MVVTNLYEWFENIVDEFYDEKAIEERTSFDNIKYRSHDDLHDNFLCIFPTLLFEFLIKKDVAHVIKLQSSLTIPCHIDWNKRKSKWEKFIRERKWHYFLRK